MAQKFNDEIIYRVLKAVYYSIIGDCTSDISRKEQLSLSIRTVDLSSDNRIEIKGYFLEFFSVFDSTGFRSTEILIKSLTKHGLELSNCRCQGYDNGSNMKGNAGLTRVPGSLGALPPKIRVSVGPPIFNVYIIFFIIYDLTF